jgi:hypothetical protein
MEATKKKKTKKEILSDQSLQAQYKDFVLTKGEKPSSVFAFCKLIDIEESEFYKHYASFEALEKAIWQGYAISTIQHIGSDAAFQQFGAREKILTFYFALAETLKTERSFVLHQLSAMPKSIGVPSHLKAFKITFEEWIDGVLSEGKGTGEIAMRPFVDKKYPGLFWMHLLFILKFWSSDDSANFEKTDAAIEKSVTLAFDLIGKGVLDNALDFGKFLYQNAKK